MPEPRRTLIIYQYYHHHEMVEKMVRLVGERGIKVDVLCWDNFKYSGCSLRGLLGLFHRIVEGRRGRFSSRVIRKLMGGWIIRRVITQHDLVDFHAYSECYLPLIKYCVRRSVPFDITLWGSDIMRADAQSAERKEYGFVHCRYIKSLDNIQRVVSLKYEKRFAAKYKTVFWGNNGYDVIDSVRALFPDVESIKQAFIPDAANRIVITCGYNGSPSQNHLRILNAIGALPDDVFDSIFLMLPLTYGASESYVCEVEDSVRRIGVPYSLYSSRLSYEDVARMRLVSDVVVNMQDTDAFSGSLQEHLYCGNVLLVGEWLDYAQLDNNGVYYKKTSFDVLSSDVADVIGALGDYKRKCQDNHLRMRGLTSWDAVIGAWAETYKC